MAKETLLQKVIRRASMGTHGGASTVHLHQRGELRLDRGKPWLPFEAEQVIQVAAPAFRWTARMRMAPLVRASIVDAYEDGRGRLVARLWGLIPVARGSGPEIDLGELLRYMAELPWCPPAYGGNDALAFRAVDTTHLEVTAPAMDREAKVLLTVDEHGDVLEAHAPSRPRSVGKAFVSSPWTGTYSGHGPLGGLRVPRRATVTWHLDDGPFECFRGTLTELLVETA